MRVGRDTDTSRTPTRERSRRSTLAAQAAQAIPTTGIFLFMGSFFLDFPDNMAIPWIPVRNYKKITVSLACWQKNRYLCMENSYTCRTLTHLQH
jgi:hypothetical protein